MPRQRKKQKKDLHLPGKVYQCAPQTPARIVIKIPVQQRDGVCDGFAGCSHILVKRRSGKGNEEKERTTRRRKPQSHQRS